MLWRDWLEEYRKSAGADCVFTLSRFPLMQQLCIGWRNGNVSFPLDQEIPADCDDLKKAAWELCEYTPQEIADKGCFSSGCIKLVMKQASAIDMIFPDGTLNDAASKLISGIIAKEIKGAVK